jgi:hypothetical protein
MGKVDLTEITLRINIRRMRRALAALVFSVWAALAPGTAHSQDTASLEVLERAAASLTSEVAAALQGSSRTVILGAFVRPDGRFASQARLLESRLGNGLLKSGITVTTADATARIDGEMFALGGELIATLRLTEVAGGRTLLFTRQNAGKIPLEDSSGAVQPAGFQRREAGRDWMVSGGVLFAHGPEWNVGIIYRDATRRFELMLDGGQFEYDRTIGSLPPAPPPAFATTGASHVTGERLRFRSHYLLPVDIAPLDGYVLAGGGLEYNHLRWTDSSARHEVGTPIVQSHPVVMDSAESFVPVLDLGYAQRIGRVEVRLLGEWRLSRQSFGVHGAKIGGLGATLSLAYRFYSPR